MDQRIDTVGVWGSNPHAPTNFLSKFALLNIHCNLAHRLAAQTCENIPNPETESLVAKISINGTNIQVADGAVIPSWTSLRFDSVIEATGSCTGMGWTSANPSSCEPNGYVWERVPNHTAITVDIATETGPLNFYVGLIYGTGGPSQHVINSAASDTTGPVYMTAGWKGTYTFHFNANINTTPCNLEPHVMEEQIITIRVGENDDATNNGPGSCEQDIANDAVGEPINVTNGNMYLQQTDYRLPGFGAGLDLTRTYNSKMQRAGLFGYGWSSFLDESIKTYNTKFLRLNLADGRAVYLARTNTTAPFVPVTSSDFHGQIVQNVDNTYTLTLKDGEVHQFDAAGKLVSLTDRNNNAITLSYTNGVPTTITDATGRTVTLTYDGSGSIQSLSDSTGTIATYTHWFWGILNGVTYADGSQFNFATTFIGNTVLLASVTDALGNVLESHTYDSQGRALTSEVAGNGTEKYTLNYVSATQTDVTDALNRVTKYFYDTSKGRNVVTSVEGNCSCGGSQIQTWVYDNQLNVTSKTDALTHTTTYTYNSTGDRLTETDATGTVTYTYNSLGQVLTRTDQMGGVTTNTYSAEGNLLTTKDALNHTTTFTYGAQGQLLTVTDPRNNTTTFTYDSNGNLTAARMRSITRRTSPMTLAVE